MEIMPNYTKCHIESNTKIYENAPNFKKIRPFLYKNFDFCEIPKVTFVNTLVTVQYDILTDY
jgi:hypothetical protein